MGLFDMTKESGTWEFRRRILAPLALCVLLPIALILYACAWVCVFLLCAITGERSIQIGRD
jgi:hypothetical protein